MSKISTRQILSRIGEPRLDLCKGDGYWHFTFDDPKANVFETHSVMVHRLNQLSLEQWENEGSAFAFKCALKVGFQPI